MTTWRERERRYRVKSTNLAVFIQRTLSFGLPLENVRMSGFGLGRVILLQSAINDVDQTSLEALGDSNKM